MASRKPKLTKLQKPRNPHVTLRATRVPDKRKEQARRACRTKGRAR